MTPTPDLAVEYRAPSELKPDKGNPRTHPKAQLAQLMASIQAFGFVNPVLVDEDGVIIAGHGRLQAARRLSLERIPVVTLSGLTEAQKKALRVADNKIALNAGWDADLLRSHMIEIPALEMEFDLTLTGFSTGEIDALLNTKSKPMENEVVPDVASVARAKLGDIWALGPHRIGCGDSRDSAFVAKVVGDGVQVDAAFMDPPYNVAIQGHANVRSRHREFAMASGEMTDGAFVEFLKATLAPAISVSRDGAVHFVCMDWRHMPHLMEAGGLYDAWLNLCVWNKSNAGMGSLYRSKHELVAVYRVGETPHFNAVELGRHGRNRTNVWDYASVNTRTRAAELEWHPTVKPAAMVADALQDVTRRGDLVLDVFLGSGTTLISAERTGRVCRGIELDPAYVDIAIERWEAMTGETAARVSSTDDGWGRSPIGEKAA